MSTANTQNLIVLRASAGSGKTYALVKHFLILALQHPTKTYYRSILAITFTNAAAAEMKHRVLSTLERIKEGNAKETMWFEIAQAANASPEEIQQRATHVLKDMLHHYGMLSILTIDSFTHRLIRSFARDLQLSIDFRIEMDATSFKEKLVDACLNAIGEKQDDPLTEYLLNYAQSNLEEGKSWNLRKQLIEYSDLILKEKTSEVMTGIQEMSLDDFRRIRVGLAKIRDTFNAEVHRTALALIQLLNQLGFATSGDGVILSGGSRSFFKKIDEIAKQQCTVIPEHAERLSNVMANDSWLPQKADKMARQAIADNRMALNAAAQDYIDAISGESYDQYQAASEILKNLYAVGLLKRLDDFGKMVKAEDNSLLIADFHKLVNEIISISDTPFIYERIGNRYNHVLFDEFQDTSTLQWINAIPLIHNALASNNMSLIVGDAKQAIYRWRGGDVEQFISLPEIPNAQQMPEAQAAMKHQFNPGILDVNRRSARAIVAFNNHTYLRISQELGKYQSVYTDAHQEPHKKHEGLVKVEYVPGTHPKDRWPGTSQTILNAIQDSVKAGYALGDITILVRRGKEASLVAQFLAEQGITAVTRDSFLVQNSISVRVLTHFIEYLINPEIKSSAFLCIASLAAIHEHVQLEDFMQNYVAREKRNLTLRFYEFITEKFGEVPTRFAESNPFELFWNIIRLFKLPSNSGLEFLLENAKQRCIISNESLQEFIDWWKEIQSKLSTSESKNPDAVNIMTIHKSKGLQFPVVIYPRFGSNGKTSEIWADTHGLSEGLPVARVGATNGLAENKFLGPSVQEELDRKLLDDVNLCYVATTRAEERLYIIQEKCGSTASASFIQAIENLKPDFLKTQIFESGEVANKYAEAQADHTIPKILHFPNSERHNIQLRIVGLHASSDTVLEGNVVHDILSKFEQETDLHTFVQERCKTFGIHDSQRMEKIREMVDSVLGIPEFQAWMNAKDFQVEREICCTDGKILRPDRIVIREDVVQVIDYKTGARKEDHKKQVQKYCETISTIYDKPIEGYLLYTKEQCVERVM